MLLESSREITPERMKRQNESRNNTELWMWLVMEVKSDAVKRNISSDQIRSVTQSCPTLCDPMNRSTPGLPVHHQLPEFTQTRWMWVWVNFWSWWWTRRPGVLRFIGSQRVGHDWATDLIWSDLKRLKNYFTLFILTSLETGEIIWTGKMSKPLYLLY